MNFKKLFFWQPKTDYLRFVNSTLTGRRLLIFFNYFIWFYLFVISYKLVNFDTNIFWQLLLATVFGEVFERLIKAKVYWRRPMFVRHDTLPTGLVKSWYESGSFPSGHTIKVAYFLLFIIEYNITSPLSFLSITLPLLFLRVVVGFHYPVDLIGGGVVGIVLWLVSHNLVAPPFLNDIIKTIFNFVFFIK